MVSAFLLPKISFFGIICFTPLENSILQEWNDIEDNNLFGF